MNCQLFLLKKVSKVNALIQNAIENSPFQVSIHCIVFFNGFIECNFFKKLGFSE